MCGISQQTNVSSVTTTIKHIIMDQFNSLECLDLQKLKADRNKYGLSAIRRGYLQFDGYTMPESFRHFQKTIEEFEVYDDDVWVTSYPKCGTTWTQEIVWCLCNQFNFNAAQSEDLDIRFPFLEYETCFFTDDVKLLQHEPGIIRNSVGIAANTRRPRFIKTHLPWELLPRQIQSFERQPKIIHVARNPKDACVSYFHHNRLMEGFTGDFDLFWKLYITGKLNYGPMLRNVLSYWYRRKEGVLFLKYEDMKKDINGVIKQIATFLQKPMNDEQLKSLEHHVSFDYLRICGAVVDQQGSFMRNGKAGAYKDLMSGQVEGNVDEWMCKELNDTGLEL